MVSLTSAIKLKQAGLPWIPVLHDYFAIPERGLDDRIFVISDMLATLEQLHGSAVVAFQGASEWALDSVLLTEAVWIPSEEQMREALEELLLKHAVGRFRLVCGMSGCRLEIHLVDEWKAFEDQRASEAYAQALLYLLTTFPDKEIPNN